jgi:hemolysin activation/secretion protein
MKKIKNKANSQKLNGGGMLGVLLSYALFSVFTVSSVVNLSAQDYDKVAPKEPTPMAPGEIKKEEDLKKEKPSRFEKVKPSTPGQAPMQGQASTFERVKPSVPGQAASGQVASNFEKVQPLVGGLPEQVIADRTLPAGMDQIQLLDSLQGLVFVDNQQSVNPDGVSGISGVKADGLTDLQSAAFKEIASKYIGQPVTLAKLNELNREVVAYYNANDFPVVDVVLPEQDITKGVVQLVVLKGKRGEVKVEGNKWFGSKLLAGQIRTKDGQEVRGKKTLADLDWLNRNPFRRVDLVYARGADVGETDMVLKVQDRFPVRVYAGYENSGNKRTGDNRWFTGFNWGNAFFLDHQLNYQYTTNNESSLFSAHSGSYTAPLPWRHILNFFGSYGETKTDDTTLNVSGRSYQISGRYTIPLPKLQNDLLTYNQEMSFGFDHKNTNNNLEFGGTSILDTTSEVDQFVATYQAGWRDDWGSTSFGANLYYSPGNIGSENTDFNFNAQRAGAEADYAYAKFNIERVNKLPGDLSLFARATAQISEANLLGSEQLGAGGFSTVRGYEEREANGDSGFITNLELRSPSLKPLQWAGLTSVRDDLQFLLFWDYASVGNKFLVAGEDANTNLSSVGPGLRYVINPYLTMRFDYGFQLMDSQVAGSNDRFSSRAHLGLILSY